MPSPSRTLLAPVLTFLARLRYRTLFVVAATLLAVDLVVPDLIPFVDEIVLAIVTIALSRMRRRPEDADVIDITPPRS